MKTAPLIPSASAMAEVSAVRVLPTRAVPLMVGAPVAGLFGLGSTAAVAALVSVSGLFLSSLNDTFTWIVLPLSASTSV